MLGRRGRMRTDRIRKGAPGCFHSSLCTLDTHVIPAKAGIHCVPINDGPPLSRG
jgi:hypothetical protein